MDITKFCATKDPRHYLHKPMRHDGFLYATNGHVAVRIEDDPAIDAGPMPERLQDSLPKLLSDNEERTWRPFPQIDPSSLRACPFCNGSGCADECPACDGEGEFEHWGDWYDCKRCDGGGQVAARHDDASAVCGRCNGSGLERNQSIEIDGPFIAVEYILLIGAEASGAEIGISKNTLGVQLFRAPGVIGCVMPMQP